MLGNSNQRIFERFSRMDVLDYLFRWAHDKRTAPRCHLTHPVCTCFFRPKWQTKNPPLVDKVFRHCCNNSLWYPPARTSLTPHRTLDGKRKKVYMNWSYVLCACFCVRPPAQPTRPLAHCRCFGSHNKHGMSPWMGCQRGGLAITNSDQNVPAAQIFKGSRTDLSWAASMADRPTNPRTCMNLWIFRTKKNLPNWSSQTHDRSKTNN